MCSGGGVLDCKRDPQLSAKLKRNWLKLFCRFNSDWQPQLKQLHPCCTRNKQQPSCKCLRNMAGTTRLELATSAVTVQRPKVTSCNFTAPIATFGAQRNPREVLSHPNHTQNF